MNVDWDALIGPDEPVIVAPWVPPQENESGEGLGTGFTDLRLHPEAAHALPETVEYPELAEALLLLNQPDLPTFVSPTFTSKCDVWPIAPEDIDPYEFDAEPDEIAHGIACYIDIIPAEPARRAAFAEIENLARAIVHDLRQEQASPVGRIELVLRPADIDDTPGYAFTLYASALGATQSEARNRWKTVLFAAVMATIKSAASS
ncbi:hypothetical protein [Silvibacterium sp.]|uniref:hypothetical protein n=1 Tax=Silvibacterium sp. TaxID=1964179 RepID=UPI0039E59E03